MSINNIKDILKKDNEKIKKRFLELRNEAIPHIALNFNYKEDREDDEDYSEYDWYNDYAHSTGFHAEYEAAEFILQEFFPNYDKRDEDLQRCIIDEFIKI